MKFRLTFKTPDVLDYLNQDPGPCDKCFDCNQTCLACVRADCSSFVEHELQKQCAQKFVQYGECITVEFDTDNSSAIVIPIR